MAVRAFTGSTDRIKLSQGSVANSMDPFTLVALVRLISDGANYVVMSPNGEFDTSTFYVASTGKLTLYNGSFFDSTVTLASADGWCVVAASKVAGTHAIRFHKVICSTGVGTHADSSGTTASITTGSVGAHTYLGNNDAQNANFQGYEDAAMIVPSALSDGSIEALASKNFADLGALVTGWLTASPTAAWRCDQASTGTALTDLTAGGANQSSITGTSVVTTDEPPFGSGSASTNATITVRCVAVTGRRDMGRRFPPASLEPSGTRTAGSGSQTLGGFERSIGPAPPQLIRPLPGQSQQTIKTSLVAVTGRRNVPRRFPLQNLEPSGTKTTGSGSQTLGAFERPLGPEPPQLVLPLPPLRAQTVQVKLAGRTRTEVSRRAPHSKLFPPAVIRSLPNLRQQTIQTSLAAVRARRVQPLRFPLQGYHGAEARTSSQVAGTIVFPARIVGPQPPQLIIPLPSLKAQTISTTLARTPRQAFRTRPFRTRPGLSVPFAPIKATTRGAARARYELGRRAAHSHLSPPAIVTTTPPPVTTAPLRALMGVGT